MTAAAAAVQTVAVATDAVANSLSGTATLAGETTLA